MSLIGRNTNNDSGISLPQGFAHPWNNHITGFSFERTTANRIIVI
jgi:hypothetical protein